MRKKLVSMALLLAFALAMLPAVALADDTAPVSDAQIHNVSALKSYCNTSDLSNSFYYGGMRSHIIGYDGEGILNAPGQVTLFTWYIYGKTQFGPNVNYADSDLKKRWMIWQAANFPK